MRHLSILLFVLILSESSFSQVQHSGWLASYNTVKLRGKWSVHFDGQLRSSDHLDHLQTILLRPGIIYTLTKKLTIAGGYAFIANRRTLNTITGYLAEHRIWEQVLYNHKIYKIATSHRLRLEQRFLPQPVVVGDDLQSSKRLTAYRLRYYIRNIIPVTKQSLFTKGPFFAVQNEVFVTTGNKDVVNNHFFDQNRLYLAVGYRLPIKVDLETGYMNQYTKTSGAFTNNHIIQIAVYKRL